MRCSFCNSELNPENSADCCPECGFTVSTNADGSVTARAVTMPSAMTRNQSQSLRSLRPGNLTLTKPVEVYRSLPLFLAFILDVSGSMDEQNKLQEAIKGLKDMLKSLLPLGEKCSVGVVEFREHSRIVHELTTPEQLVGQLAISAADGGTNIGAGLRDSGKLLANHNHEGDTQQIIVLLSDGEDVCNSSPVEEAIKLRAEGKVIITIGYGYDQDAETLRSIATSPELYFAKGAGGRELEAFLRNLGSTLTASIRAGQSVQRSVSMLR